MNQQWNYKVVQVEPGFGGLGSIKSENVQDILNQHGIQGWELTHVHQPAFNFIWLYLKKPK
jgi:hypothetical protein